MQIGSLVADVAARALAASRAGKIRDTVAIAVTARSHGLLPPTDAGLHLGIALAEHAVVAGARPAALFWWMVHQPDAGRFVTAEDERRASAAIQRARLNRNAPPAQAAATVRR